MRTAALAIALLMSGAAIAQTTTTTEPDIDVDADVGIQPDGDLDVDADVDVDTKTVVTTPVTTTHVATTHMAMAPASGAIVQPSNADPEHDARGIAVISDPAVVPSGFNGVAGTALGGPLVDPATGATVDTDASYPACTATVTDNCVQTYERGRPN
jgi:hypothetical protein